MLNKKYNEQDVRQLFSSQGCIEECTVLRDQNGQSKGCAFVTYATKQSAISAIKVIKNTNIFYAPAICYRTFFNIWHTLLHYWLLMSNGDNRISTVR